jgi:diaminohydroxyphosphoribosylaminopyrimidine deaminase/5-amino-6-(5-phosphoribosylamino)uracil reductase
MNSDERYMQRCFDLALNGAGLVSPNPLVGCVITNNGEIIGEGWHKKYGGPHAEVNAVASVKDRTLLQSSTVYVNLEPCSHFGKTPPCADMLVDRRVKKVVLSNIDSNKLVSGKGIEKLRKAGIEVVTGVLEAEGRDLNRRFFTYIETGRPYIILKWAQTSDGFISKSSNDASRISNEFSRQLVHRWRTEEDAFLVGTQTAAIDNPRLNVREWAGRNPLRVVIDRSLRLDQSLHLFDRQQPTICYNTIKNEDNANLTFVKIEADDFCLAVARDLRGRKVQSVVVEGGSETLGLFISSGLWDEARVLISAIAYGDGLKAPLLPGEPASSTDVGGDTLLMYQNFSVTPAPLK